VKKRKADIGVAFDGDGDRIGVVDWTGPSSGVTESHPLSLATCSRARGKGQSIIFDVKCSQALTDAIEKAGGKAGHVEDGTLRSSRTR
jgi:phosphomannomutase